MCEHTNIREDKNYYKKNHLRNKDDFLCKAIEVIPSNIEYVENKKYKRIIAIHGLEKMSRQLSSS